MKMISIVIPVYNTGELLYKCFDSIVSQTIGLDNIEAVVVDDGSTDGISPAIMKEYESRYPDSFKCYSKANGGQGSARNMGFKYCTGEYISCLDSDDQYDPAWAEKMYKAAKDNNADFVGCGYKAVRYDGDKEIVVRDLDMRPICSTNREMFIDANVSMFTTLFKREILVDSGAFYPEGFIYEDTAFFAELLPWISKPVYITEALSVRTLHEGSTMTSVRPEKVANIMPVFDALLSFYKGKGLYEDYKSELDYLIGKVMLFSNLNRVSFVDKRRDRRELVSRSYDYIRHNISDLSANPYIKGGVKGYIMKHYSKLLMNLMVEILHIRFKVKKDYNT
ncbi:glycosyltransferase family 2 protein [Butyrivibrio sp. MC2013]|uniref:glycosyltransferase family 2 protein n=1 Tax=Butyrivibrio sp. MC2013 TaxID=1280686 RepID=UPI0003FA0CEF|nr:glycosyltransferase family 2 protein [Butyrivibrio sp. MC2013]